MTTPYWKFRAEYEELVEDGRSHLVGQTEKLAEALEDAMLTLDAVMQLGIDKWLTGDQLREEPAQRATLAREIALRRLEAAWEPSGSSLPDGLSTNPDAAAWADAFLATFPNLGADKETMLGWFANAMMAKHDRVTRISAT